MNEPILTPTPAAQHLLSGSPYQSYVYSYPHKTAYRPLTPRPLREVWAAEPHSSLFLYLHVPFCEQRCGFCNLFTSVPHGPQRPERYLQALQREAGVVAAALGGDARFHRLAIGGGTPTWFEVEQLERLLAIVTDTLATRPADIPSSVETSPLTATEDRLALLRAYGIDRISIGVQTFDSDESKRLGRRQSETTVAAALQAIRDAGFPTLNIDLIYGGDGQTPASWRASLDQALAYQPEELYLYPLYLRPQTGLGRHARGWDDARIELYRLGRAQLLAAGYQQLSMRLFKRAAAPGIDAPVYCCQQDGMIGLGCGARSYTRGLHYSGEYAVGRQGVLAILDDYLSRDDERFAQVAFGVGLDLDEQCRRFVLMSLLQADGLDRSLYAQRFASDAVTDLPMLAELPDLGLATIDRQRLRLTAAGLERSDAIGPWLWSTTMRHRMQGYQWR